EGAGEDAPRAGAAGQRPGIDPGRDAAAVHRIDALEVRARVVAPALLARLRVDRDHAVLRRADVERVAEEDRRVLERRGREARLAVEDVAVGGGPGGPGPPRLLR